MNKIGQITIFVVITIFIIIAIVIGFYILKNKQIEPTGITSPPQHIRFIIAECLEEVTRDAYLILGEQSGYVFLPIGPEKILFTGDQEIEEISYFQVPYVYYDGTENIPELNLIKQELSDFIEVEMLTCFAVKDIKANAEAEGYSLEILDTRPETHIFENKVSFKITGTAILRKGSGRVITGEFSSEFPIRIGFMLEVMQNVVNNIKNREGDELAIDYLYDTGLNVNIYPFDNDAILFIMKDPLVIIDEDPYTFMFAVKVS